MSGHTFPVYCFIKKEKSENLLYVLYIIRLIIQDRLHSSKHNVWWQLIKKFNVSDMWTLITDNECA